MNPLLSLSLSDSRLVWHFILAGYWLPVGAHPLVYVTRVFCSCSICLRDRDPAGFMLAHLQSPAAVVRVRRNQPKRKREKAPTQRSVTAGTGDRPPSISNAVGST